MGKASKRKRSRIRDKTKKKGKSKIEDEDLEAEDEEVFEQKMRKRSQAVQKRQLSSKKKDRIVLAFAVFFIIITLLTYYYYDFYLTPDDSDDDGDENGGPGNYTGTIHIISHITHNYGKRSWHIVNIGGHTDFLIKVENTGTKEDNYKLLINNLDTRVKITLNDNEFKLKPTKAKLVIAKVTTSIKTEYRLPTPIKVDLISGHSKSVLDFVEMDITVEDLDETEVVEKDQKVSAYYTGAFEINGSLFDHSLKDPDNKDPLYISLSNDVQMDEFESRQYVPVIAGFKVGVIGMLPEETHVIVVPPEQGYPTDHFLGGLTLIFEVNVISNDVNV